MKTENRNFFIARAETYLGDYYNPPFALYQTIRGKTKQLVIIGCGSADNTRLFREGDDIVIYSANDSLEYMAIEIYALGDIETTSRFIENDSFRELAHLQPINRAKALYNDMY